MDQKQFLSALSQISEEKGISKERVIETIEMAVAAAYKREYGKRGQIVRAKMDPETGVMAFTQVKLVVEPSMLKSEEEIAQEEQEAAERMTAAAEQKMPPRRREMEEESFERLPEGEEEKKIRFNTEKHILLEDARKEQPAVSDLSREESREVEPPEINVGDEFIMPLETHDEFGRIAAQTAKQVIIQRIREAERDAVFATYKSQEGELVSGIIQRVEGHMVYVDLGKTIATLFGEEQILTERYRIGQRLRFLLVRVEMTGKGPMVMLSRAHPGILRKLFALEVPEVASGTVEIKAIAREGGSRTKVAVTSKEEGIDPIGSCVGQRGTRVQTVINEIGGEKIDIIEWSENPEVFIAHALSPAKVLDVTLYPDDRKAVVEVPPDQLSLAIGQKGQNVRLAAKLTGWRIDIKGASLPAVSELVPSEVEGVELPAEAVTQTNAEENATQTNAEEKEPAPAASEEKEAEKTETAETEKVEEKVEE